MTIDDIKALIASGSVPSFGAKFVDGELARPDGNKVPFELIVGWDIATANACDEDWGSFNVRLMSYIQGLALDDEALKAMLEGVQLDDHHWRWLSKSIAFHSDEYTWFFLIAEGKPQAACLTYHPKDSAFDGRDIFYIEFVAVAPWNRKNPMSERSFKGVGKLMVKLVTRYAIDELRLRPGFSLHSLPKAIDFYVKLGMQAFPDRDKEKLPYFEMPEMKCKELVA